MQHSVPYTPHQNGVALCKNKALKEMETCMIEEKNCNPNLCDESINYAMFVQNIDPHKLMDGKTPYEAWFGHKPNISHFKIFGSRVWARIPPEKRNALHEQIKECNMVNIQMDAIYLILQLKILLYKEEFNSKKRSFQILN